VLASTLLGRCFSSRWGRPVQHFNVDPQSTMNETPPRLNAIFITSMLDGPLLWVFLKWKSVKTAFNLVYWLSIANSPAQFIQHLSYEGSMQTEPQASSVSSQLGRGLSHWQDTQLNTHPHTHTHTLPSSL